MKNQKGPNAAALLVMTIALTAVLAGCGGGSGTPTQPAADNTPAAVNADNAAEAANQPAADTKPVNADTEPAAEAAPVQGTGTFVGQIDPHSVAIRTADGETAFQVGEDLADAVSSLKQDDPVTYSYTEKVVDEAQGTKQLTLTAIAAADSASAAGGAGAAAALPAEKTFTLTLEGNKEERTAKLSQADGYALYVFEQFAFDAASNTLSMNVDRDYNVKIEKLAPDAKLDDLRKEAEAVLSGTGKAIERSGEEIAGPIRDAKLFLSASNDKLQQEVIVREIGGRLYRYTVNMPAREASEGFGPIAFVSMKSVVDQS